MTYELVNLPGLPLTFAPVFPSLIREGSPGGGYDVEIPTGSSTGLFLQFKTCEQITRRRANIREVAAGMDTPFLRLPLRKERSYSQHDQSLRLESVGAYVAYVGPGFVETAVLNDNFYKKETVYKSVWVRPSEIPSSFDRTAKHWMSFERKAPFRWDFYSESVEHRRLDANFEVFLGNLGKVTDSQPRDPREILDYYLRIRDVLKEMVQENIVGLVLQPHLT